KKPPATTVSETDARAFTAIVAASFATEDGNAARGEALEVPPVMSNAAPRATVQDGPKGVEGWLTLFCIGLIIGPLFTLLEMSSNWEQAKPAFDRFPPLKTAVIFENLGCVALWIYGFVVGWTVFRESPSGGKLSKQYLLIRFFVCMAIELF